MAPRNRAPYRPPGARPPGPRRDRGPSTPREMRGLNVDPRKSLGQHFLLDEDVLKTIVALAEVGPGDRVLEIGSGLGALTEPLAATGASVLAVEIDEALCSQLRRRFDDPLVQVACIDVLTLPPGQLLGMAGLQPPYRVVANLPYYISALVIRHFLEADDPPERMVLMVQREVAQSIIAPPPKMSLLGVSVQAYARAQLAFRVPPSAFFPPPKVDSAVIRLDVRRHPALPDDMETFFKMVRGGFSGPRKQLHNALPQRLWMPEGAASELLEASGIDSMRRAQTLSIDEWARLTEAYIDATEEWRARPQ